MVTALTIPTALQDAAERFANHEAVVDGDTRLTFGQLQAEATVVAQALIAAGIEPGDRVAVGAPNSARWIVASFGVYAAGAVLVPLNTRYRGEEAGHILRTSGARLLLTVGDFLGTSYVELLDGVQGLDALEETILLDGDGLATFVERGGDVDASAVDARVAALGPDDLSDIIF